MKNGSFFTSKYYCYCTHEHFCQSEEFQNSHDSQSILNLNSHLGHSLSPNGLYYSTFSDIITYFANPFLIQKCNELVVLEGKGLGILAGARSAHI